MTDDNLSHARKNLLTGEWILVSPQRNQRPWQGQVDTRDMEDLPEFDPDCYLCPGNTRANGEVNRDYRGTFVFDNDFPALTDEAAVSSESNPLLKNRPEPGICRVVCYTERHDRRLTTMPMDGVSECLKTLADEFSALDSRDDISYVQMFENRGSMMGCSNPHPHAQIWATRNLPTEIEKELREQQRWYESKGSPLLADYLDMELQDGSRVVTSNEHFVTLVPYWASWPYEMMVLPRRPYAALIDATGTELDSLGQILVSSLSAIEDFFDTPAPYSMGFHPRPSDGQAHPEWVFHIHICPPLLRSATIRKHMVGFEMFGMPQRDITPEQAAEQLRSKIKRAD